MIRPALRKMKFRYKLAQAAQQYRSRQAAGAIPPWPEALKQNCRTLQTWAEIEAATEAMRDRGLWYHPAVLAKNWDLMYVLANIGPGPALDMGCVDSGILDNLIISGNDSELHGIDLRETVRKVPGVQYVKGDLMATPYPARSFANLCCLSVIEHGVDYGIFLDECVRLLKPGGKIFITYDYWPDWRTDDHELFGLPWLPLNESRLANLLEIAKNCGLVPDSELQMAVDKPLITGDTWAPFKDVSYTFAMLTLRLGDPI